MLVLVLFVVLKFSFSGVLDNPKHVNNEHTEHTERSEVFTSKSLVSHYVSVAIANERREVLNIHYVSDGFISFLSSKSLISVA